MRYGLLAAIVTGAVIATAVYLLLRFTCNYFISTHYSSEWRREERERAFARDLQTYIDENNVSSTNTGYVKLEGVLTILVFGIAYINITRKSFLPETLVGIL